MTIGQNPDATAIVPLLLTAGLSVDDLPADLRHFLTLGEASMPDGVVGLELYGAHALLRSLAVNPDLRGQGLGVALLKAAEDHARAEQATQLFLLTETAEQFFAAHGWRRLERSEAPAAIRQTRQFSDLCPDDAAFMTKQLN